MDAIVISNGEAPSKALIESYLSENPMLICCDGAANLLEQYQLTPHMMIGDFDSLGIKRANELREKWQCEFIELPVEKDETDTQSALDYAIRAGAKNIALLGGYGKRFDHAIANALLLVHCKLKGANVEMIDEKNTTIVSCSVSLIDTQIGENFSIVPLSVNTRIRCTDGLKYPLYDQDLPLGSTRGISNIAIANRILVDVADGWVCLIRSQD